MLNRIKIIQRLIDVSKASNYLEIGVNNGACFLRVRARKKIAVDPAFRIPAGRKLKYFFKNPTNINNLYFSQTSDDFFAANRPLLEKVKPQVVLVDGLHTYEQSLRDVLNSLEFLDRNGVVLMHDCNPLSEASAYPAESIHQAQSLNLPHYNNLWNGDVWKSVVHLRSLHPDLEVFVLDCDHGVGVVRRRSPAHTLKYSKEKIQSLSYHDFEKDRNRLLNLKPPDFFEEFIGEIISSRKSPMASPSY